MIYYRTQLADTHDEKATFGITSVWQAFSSHWREIGRTNNFRTYNRSVRARNAANRLAYKDCERRGLPVASIGIVVE